MTNDLIRLKNIKTNERILIKKTSETKNTIFGIPTDNLKEFAYLKNKWAVDNKNKWVLDNKILCKSCNAEYDIYDDNHNCGVEICN